MAALRPGAASTALFATAIVAGALFAPGPCFADRIDIVSEAQASTRWQPDPAHRRYVAGYPEAATDRTRDVCVSIGYLIKIDGSTSNFTEMKSWGSGGADGALTPAQAEPYVQVAALVVSRWRFVPVGRARSIYTSATFAFDGSKALGEAAIRDHCRIDDLRAFVARGDARANLNRDRAERARANRTGTTPMESQE